MRLSIATDDLGQDFLHEETRKERRNLQIVAVIGLLVVALNLVPNRISAVGVDFGEAKKQSFLIIRCSEPQARLFNGVARFRTPFP
jgi:hypothetical protein